MSVADKSRLRSKARNVSRGQVAKWALARLTADASLRCLAKGNRKPAPRGVVSELGEVAKQQTTITSTDGTLDKGK